jgi:hypothetical protein
MNYYRAVEKKAEHGGGWAFMQLNRRAGAAIVCGCGAGGWEQPGHVTAVEAERCFYDGEKAKGVRWSTQDRASRCAICDQWTPDVLHGASNLIHASQSVCHSHFDDVDEVRALDGLPAGDAGEWLWRQHPFSPGIEIVASW